MNWKQTVGLKDALINGRIKLKSIMKKKKKKINFIGKEW